LFLRAFIVLALFVLVVPAAAAARPDPSSRTATVSVGPGQSLLTLGCPRGGVALSGSVIAMSPDVTLRDSLPDGITGWTFRFTGTGNARANVRCVRVPPSGGLRRSTVRVASRTFDGTVPPHSSISATLRCARGFVPTGYGLQQAPSGTATVAVARPGRRAWSFVLENDGNGDTRPRLHARCLARAATARGPNGSARHPLVVRVAGFRDRVSGGERRRVTHSCPRGFFSAGTGHSVPVSDDIEVTRAFTNRARLGRFTFVNPGGAPATARSFLACLSLRTGFR
jgi:hypothetical protein